MAENAIEVKEKPILFSGEMVCGIIERRKSQTRRLRNLDEINANPDEWHFCGLNGLGNAVFTQDEISYKEVKNPYGDKGDRLWVRETWQHVTKGMEPTKGCRLLFRADDIAGHIDNGWRPSIHMPRWASRFNLEITEVRVQRAQEITEADAIADGVVAMTGEFAGCFTVPGTTELSGTTAKECYSRLWDKINLKRGFGWDKNPWVWAISFKRAAHV